MDIERAIRETAGLTPAEQQLAVTVQTMGERIQHCGIKELARAANVSVPSVHRFCKKLGLEGFKDLQVELARAYARHADTMAPIDINFPFGAGDDGAHVARKMESVYEATLRDTRSLLDRDRIDRAAALIDGADTANIYTQSHNLYPAQMFCDRLLSIGKQATCHEGIERNIRLALASGTRNVAVLISYSGLAESFRKLIPLLVERSTPCILISTPRGCRINPGLDVYLPVSDRESLQNRITQFASHIAVQYVLDALFGALFARGYDRNRAFLERSLPYTRIPALGNEPLPRISPEGRTGGVLREPA